MLFKSRFWPGLADGTITLAFRRWRRPQVRAGGSYRTPAGMLQVDDLRVVDPDAITAREAKQAGYADVASLRRDLDAYPGTVHRVRFHFAGADPRVALRADAKLGADDWAALATRLERLDRASRRGPWTAVVLRLIAERPGVRAGDLATSLGRDQPSFKADVRKLKELGLTASLEVGYRLSPRGCAALRRLERGR
jgi:hypothetical protein